MALGWVWGGQLGAAGAPGFDGASLKTPKRTGVLAESRGRSRRLRWWEQAGGPLGEGGTGNRRGKSGDLQAGNPGPAHVPPPHPSLLQKEPRGYGDHSGSSLWPSWGCTVRVQVRRGGNLLENVFEVRPPDPALHWGLAQGAGPQPFRMPSEVRTENCGSIQHGESLPPAPWFPLGLEALGHWGIHCQSPKTQRKGVVHDAPPPPWLSWDLQIPFLPSLPGFHPRPRPTETGPWGWVGRSGGCGQSGEAISIPSLTHSARLTPISQLLLLMFFAWKALHLHLLVLITFIL